ncbi:MAG: ABC transporter ATP-binding protein [Candidatus Competibacteraceae bacterium]|nr:ABC transporter ATP-binding protein [Candidatus Competibacteraceae bacterium]
MTLRLENVSKKVGPDTHIYPMDLELEPGGFNVLLGATLAGKTSLMRLMAGLDKPTTGRILMAGQDVTDLPVQKRNVAMVYQQFINYPSLNVYDNIASPLKVLGLDKSKIDRRVREAAELVHIEPFLQRLPGELSGGQQQRCAMARALVKEADLLLFDEPLVNLDYKLREELRYEMREIFRHSNTIAVYASTEPAEALALGGNTAIMYQGRLVQFGPTVGVYHNPANVEVGKVFSDPPINLFPGRLDDRGLHIGRDIHVPLVGHLSQLQAGDYRIGVRANHLYVHQHSEQDVELDCQVDLAEIGGSETFIHARHGEVEVTVQQEGAHEFHLGDPIRVYVDPRHLFIFDGTGALVAAPERRKPQPTVV